MQLPAQLSRENIPETEKCDFDLCSSCAEKEDIENVCPRGHKLQPVQLSGESIFCWMCDACQYQCSPEGTVDEAVVVWRCEKDKRHSGGELVGPGGAQTDENEQSESQVSSNSQFFPVSNKTDQDSHSGDGEVTSAGEGGESGGAPAPAEKDQQSSYLSMGARPKTRQDKK